MAVLGAKQQKEIDKLRDLAFKKQGEKKIQEMTDLYEQAWSLYPEPTENWNEAYNLAKYAFLSYLNLKNFEKAKLWINRMNDVNNNLNINDEEVLFYRSVYLFETGQYEMAYDHFSELMRVFGSRSFQGEDPKYRKFAKAPSAYLNLQKDTPMEEEETSEELTTELYDEIMALLEAGDEAADNEDYDKAIDFYNMGLTKLPAEPFNWDISLHIYTAMGDTYYNMDNQDKALDSYSQALMCPGGVESGYVWFGLGSVLYEQQEMEKAEDAFMRAYMLEGEEIFENIEPSYLELIRKHIRK